MIPSFVAASPCCALTVTTRAELRVGLYGAREYAAPEKLLRGAGAIVAEAAEQGQEKNFDVAPQGPILDVIQIVLDARRQ